MRPRFNPQELELIAYALNILKELADFKGEEKNILDYELRKFARFLWYSGDLKAMKIYKPFKQYVLEVQGIDYFTLENECRLLLRRVNGLLDGRRFHRINWNHKWCENLNR